MEVRYLNNEYKFRSRSWHPLIQYKISILSLAGDVQGTFTPSPDPGFGVRSVAWHPSGMFLAVGGWDDKVSVTVIPL